MLGLWVATFAYYGSEVLYHPAEIEKPAYPLIAEGEGASEEQPAEATPAPEAPSFDPANVVAMLASADAEAGAKISRKCAACHSFDKGGPNKVGPHLWDVVGRKIASVEDFNYSDSLSGHGGEWTYENLAMFVHKPKDFASGTKMSFAGIKDDQDLANLIAFLHGQSDNPKPLP
jgi:cytochrome c